MGDEKAEPNVTVIQIETYGDDVALCGPETPKMHNVSDLLKYCATVLHRFGNTCIVVDLKWGASALNARSVDKSDQGELERVKRYDLVCRNWVERMELDNFGEWVQFDDIKPILDARDAETERLERRVERRDSQFEAQAKELAKLRAERADVEAHLKHMGLEPWHDGRSIHANKVPWAQYIGMVLGYLVANQATAKTCMKIDKLRAERDAAIEIVTDMVSQHCSVEKITDHELDSYALSANADAMRFLVSIGHLRVIREYERRVLASWNQEALRGEPGQTRE